MIFSSFREGLGGLLTWFLGSWMTRQSIILKIVMPAVARLHGFVSHFAPVSTAVALCWASEAKWNFQLSRLGKR